MDFNNSAITITFGDVAENHVGMQKLGTLSDVGYSLDDLNNIKYFFDSHTTCELLSLHEELNTPFQNGNEAYLLIIKDGVNVLLQNENGANLLYEEQQTLTTDKKAKMYGRVVNKHARHNLCFGEQHQNADYENGKGTVYAFSEVPILQTLKSSIQNMLNDENQLQAEGNYYYDVSKCGIGFHGDTERKKVIGVRLGTTIPLCFLWFYRGNVKTNPMVFENIEHGDIYVMSEKTTGHDWKQKNIPTLRHSAGCPKFTTFL